MIVGFPGETEADFEATCRVVSDVGFCKVHVFPYSQRAGTPAAHYLDQIHPSIIADRRERLLELGATLAAHYHRELVGRRLDVMVEGEDPKRPGYSPRNIVPLCTRLLTRPRARAPRQSSIRHSRGGQRRWRYRLALAGSENDRVIWSRSAPNYVTVAAGVIGTRRVKLCETSTSTSPFSNMVRSIAYVSCKIS